MPDPIQIGRSVAEKMPDLNTALVVLDVVLGTNWPGIEGYIARVVAPQVANWRVKPPLDIVRRLQATLIDPVDLLDFSESFLRRCGLPEPLISVVNRIMQNDIELQGKTASFGAHWGLTLREASAAGCPVLGWRE